MRLIILLKLLPTVLAVEIAELQGSAYQSPFAGQSVTNVTGLVTANSSSGFWLSSVSADDNNSDNAIYVYTTSKTTLAQVAPGDIVTLSAKVAEYRSNKDYIFLTELSSPANITKLSSGNPVTPIVIGVNGLHPPTQQFSSLDEGGVLAVPNNVSLVSVANPTRKSDQYGLDFWEGLSGKLVKITSPTAVSYPNSYKDFWVRGDWPVTGLNGRGGLTITLGDDGLPDLNPETVSIGSPLDGTKNPDVWMGSTVSDIVGVATYSFGFYQILPLTAPTVIAHNTTLQGPTALTVPADDANCTLTFGDYNVENMTFNSTHLPTVATHISDYLKNPDLVFLQEVQDDTGPADDGVVSSNKTLDTLVSAITAHGGANYSYTYIAPVNDQDGGEPGGNIRPVFLYRSERLKLVNPNYGGSTDKTEAVNQNGAVGLTFNPGRIDPANTAWNATRKPLVALFESIPSGERLFAINVHMSSKGGSSSIHGDARPPVNGVVDKRIAQVKLLADFVGSILTINPNASIIASGDFNEYGQTNAVYDSLHAHLKDIDEAAGIPPVERYTYVFDMNSQQLDHAFISPKLQPGAEVEHLHINNWVKYSERTSDHDPSVARVKLCKASTGTRCATKTYGTWCAKELPTFNKFGTCLASSYECWKDSIQCYSASTFPNNVPCASYQLQCSKDSAYCLKCLTGSCGPTFP
ncbi:DNase I-like protein [Serendipita vermifera]|nr:DNase I-like protein [Serendipita vermifera]